MLKTIKPYDVWKFELILILNMPLFNVTTLKFLDYCLIEKVCFVVYPLSNIFNLKSKNRYLT